MIPDAFYLQRVNKSGNGYLETNLTALAKSLSENSYFRDLPKFTQTTGYSYVETGTVTGLQVTGYGTGANGNINFTGYGFFSEPFSYKIENLNTFSGHEFKGDIRSAGSFLQNQINLGLNNRNFSGSRANMLGIDNNASSGLQTKSYILGGLNTLNKSDSSNIFGFNNKIDSAQLSISIGDSNQTTNGTYNNLNLGFSNLISGLNNPKSQDTYNIGWGNKSVNTTGVKVFGEANSIKSVTDAVVLGENIFLEKSSQINAIGKNLSINEAFHDIVIGTYNTLDYTYKNTLLGVDSEIFDSSKVYLIGENNLSTGDDRNYILGRDNESTLNKESHIIGDDNLISNSTNLNFFGNFSEIKGLTDSTSIGEVNNLNNSFAITVIGKGNDVSGLLNGIIVGESNGQGYLNTGANLLPTTGLAGKNLYIFGRSNYGKNNENLFTFGESNIGLDSYNSYIIGNENIASKAFNSYVFGQSNSISGSQNYVIGNNNEVRSGDYNSIFIGINYTPTGANKTATISLAAADSKIEINPSEIRLDSVTRPKINGENIIIQSEFDTMADSLKQNGPTFSTNTFQDSYYDKLSNKVFLPSFNYKTGASNTLTSAAGEASGVSSLFLNKFNIFGPTSYTGVSGFNIIYGNHTSPKFSPAWLVVDNSTSGVYYKNDITPFNRTPQSGWYATGFRDGSRLYTGTSNNFGVNLRIATSGYMSVSTSSFGTIYIPFFY